MKIDLAILAAYVAILMFTDPSSALGYSLAAGLLGAGVAWLTQSKHFYLAFRWFRSRVLQGLALAGLVAVFVLLPFFLGPLLFNSTPRPLEELPRVLGFSPIAFLWFWAFLAAGARFQERRINQLVERKLAERQRAEHDRGTRTDA